MKIIVAPDSFKESLSAVEVSQTIKDAIISERADAEVDVYPMADGGEGILETLVYATKGRFVDLIASGPLGKKIHTKYGVLGDGRTAVIEIAKMSGLMQVCPSERNPMHTTTYGIGEAIVHALEQGHRKFIVGLGGSATNDGGFGMLQALGGSFLDENGCEVSSFGSSLLKIKKVDLARLHPKLKECDFVIASDVMNPLCGQEGATYVFGAQKGAAAGQLKKLDEAMQHYANLIEAAIGKTFQHEPGAGAAGGLGFAFMILGSRLQSGAELAARTIGLHEAIRRADWVITGEGKSDAQTLYGKVPVYVAKLARKHQAKALLISGSLGEGYEALYQYFDACFSIVNQPMPLEKAMSEAKMLLYQQARNVSRLIK